MISSQQFNMGVVGAAVATVVGQYAGLVILCQAATTRSKVWEMKGGK